MAIISLEFTLFCLAALVLWFLLPGKWRRYWLLCASYIFYGWKEPRFLIFLLLSTLSVYVCARRIEAAQPEAKKRWLVGCLLLNLGVLAFLKYSNFVIDCLYYLGLPLSRLPGLILPLGISFYTFQSLGYLIDVYRGSLKAESDLSVFALYVAFFPQVAQGPIGRYAELTPQLKAAVRFDGLAFSTGLRRILWGCFKKIVVADRIAIFVNAVYADSSGYTGGVLAITAVMYAFQLYADFSGFMDIALGIGQCFGIQLAENFDGPFFSRSIAEFWRRWHITLGSWFRDYVYYPVLRSRLCDELRERVSKRGKKKLAGKLVTALALACVWLLIGIWHGAAWTYLVYGILNGTVIISAVFLSPFYAKLRSGLHLNEKQSLYTAFQMLRTFLLASLFLIFFRSADLTQASLIIRRIFTLAADGSTALTSAQFSLIDQLLVSGAILAILAADALSRSHSIFERVVSWPSTLRWTLDFILLFLVIIFRVSSAGSFIYFQF